MKSKYGIINFLLIFFISFAIHIFWNNGIDGDHAGYFVFSRSQLFGDFQTTGKPPLFYIINYIIFHGLSVVVGKWQPMIVSLFYIVVLSHAIVYFSGKLFDGFKRLILSLVLALMPITFVNYVQYMMETPLLIIILLFMGIPVSMKTSNQAKYIYIILVGVIGLLIKETFLPAAFFLFLYYFKEVKSDERIKVVKVIFFTILISLALRFLPRTFLNVQDFNFTVFSQKDIEHIVAVKIKYYFKFLYSLFWFLFPVFIFIPATVLKRKFIQFNFVILFFFSTFLYFISLLESTRYHTPMLFSVMLIVFSEAKESITVRRLLGMMLVNIIFLVNTTTFLNMPFKLWPFMYTREHINSGGTILAGFPLYFRLLVSPSKVDGTTCIYSPPENNGELNFYIKRFVSGPFNKFNFYENELNDKNCNKIYAFFRTYNFEHFTEYKKWCESRIYKVFSKKQNIVYFSPEGGHTEENPGIIYNLTCER